MAQLTEKLTPENSLFARKFLEASLALDPHSAEAWSQLALVLVRDFLRHWNGATEKDVDRAEEAVQKAFAAAPWIATAHLADGYIRRSRGNEAGALDAFERALAANPNLALAYSAKAGQLISLGRAKEAPELLTKAITISPSDPDIGFFYNYMGRAYFAMEEYDQAIKWFEKSVQLQPTLYYNRAWLISAYALTKRLQQHEAQAALVEYRKQFKNWGLQNIRDWFAEREPNPSPGFKATLDKFYEGLEKARL